MSGTQSGSKTLNPSSTQSSKPSSGQSAQGMEKSGKDTPSGSAKAPINSKKA